VTALDYTCNVCGEPCRTEREQLGRETPSCPTCLSTVRMREVTYLASLALFGAGLPIRELPVRPHLRAVGLSDWWEYGDRLAHHIDYRNTWYHEEPRLDITDVPDVEAGTYDLVIASDVFEHVLPPVQRAFDGAARLLKPGGAFVLTVPWAPDGETTEHYPDAVDYDVIDVGGHHEVDIVTASGERRRVREPCFHGGPGSTLELRVFSLPGILRCLAAAGFRSVRVLREDVEEFGIVRASAASLPLLARR
jgi:SAM-dependent methyltransferase